MKISGFFKSLIIKGIFAFAYFYAGFTNAYSQNSFYSDPLLISTDTAMISTMAATALDKDGNLHIAYVGWYYEEGAPDGVASEIFYTNNIGGEFMEPEKLPEAELPFPALFEDDFYYSKEPTIAVDSVGIVHVAYYRTEIQLDGSSWICYTNNRSGEFSVPRILYYDPLSWNSEYYSYGNKIMLAAGPDTDSIHIVYDGNSGTGHGGVRYSKGVDGNFRVPVAYTTTSERSTIEFDHEGIPNIVYWIHSDTSDIFSDVNLGISKIIGGKISEPSILYESNSFASFESAFLFDMDDNIHVVYRNVSGVAGATQMQYIEGKDGQYTAPADLPTVTGVSLMYGIAMDNNQTEFIAYKQAAYHQSVGLLYNEGSGFRDISPTDYDKYGFMSAGPQWFTFNTDSNKAYFVYTTGYIYLVVADLTAPSAPLCSGPPNNEPGVSVSPDIVWHTSDRAFEYNLQVSTSEDFSELISEENNIIDTLVTIDGLSNGTTYYWRVNARNSGGTSYWSDVWSFTTIQAIPDIPTLSGPANSSVDQPLSLTLNWNLSDRAESYSLQVSAEPAFSSTILDEAEITSTSKEINGLENITTYYWRVNASNTGGTSDWSDAWSFTTVGLTGIDNSDLAGTIKIYPAPVADILTIEGIENENTKVSVISTDGKLLKQINGRGINQIDLSNLQNGTYLLKISNSKLICNKKIIKQ